MSRENILEINNLIVGFRRENAPDDLIAVKGVSLSLAKGETLALVGESGCGKTVLSKSVLKLLCEKGRIHDGEIFFDGKDLTPLSPQEMRGYRGKGIAMIFQDPAAALDPAFSVGEQIAEVLRIHKGMSRKAAEERVLALMEKVQIPDAAERYHQRPYQFSGGMRQRILIAMALAGEPELLIADEPTTALDEETQQEVLRLLKDVQQETGAAMLFITHDLSLVEKLAERVAIMKDGVIVESGSVAEVFAAPSHGYTRELLGYLDDRKRTRHKHGSGDCGKIAEEAEAERASSVTDSCRRPLLSVENLSKSFVIGKECEIQVLKDFSMELYAGEILGIVGSSGCGKTTLARCIMGIEKPDAGTISTESRIQMIFQDSATAFNDRMTVREIIAEPLVIRRMLKKGGKDVESVCSAMQATGLDYEIFSERKPYELSGGQRQRVAIARALIAEPDIIIADEPLTGLDISAQAQIAHLFRKLADERGIAVLFIAHDRQMVGHISDRVIEIQPETLMPHRATES